MTPYHVEAPDTENLGRLACNNMLYCDLIQSFSSGEGCIKNFPLILEEFLEDGAWMDRIDQNGKRYPYPTDGFNDFIRAPYPKGMETTPEMIRRILGSDHPALLVKFEQTLDRGKGGARPGQSRTEAGLFEARNPNIIRIADTDDDVSPEVSPTRDRSAEPKAGTSAGYAIRRLGRERPEILARVESGELSPHGGMVLAGLSPKKITIPAKPADAGRLLSRHFTPEEFNVLVGAALDAYGVAGEPS